MANIEHTRESRRIKDAGYKPKKCPACGNNCLWPPERKVMNSLSRRDNNTYICNPCGRKEALTDFCNRKP